jgi:hypothetical protein
VQLHQCLGNRQAEAGALLPARKPGIDLAEGREREGDLRLRHADAGIADADADPPSASALAVTATLPPAGVNLMALLMRLLNT